MLKENNIQCSRQLREQVLLENIYHPSKIFHKEKKFKEPYVHMLSRPSLEIHSYMQLSIKSKSDFEQFWLSIVSQKQHVNHVNSILFMFKNLQQVTVVAVPFISKFISKCFDHMYLSCLCRSSNDGNFHVTMHIYIMYIAST